MLYCSERTVLLLRTLHRSASLTSLYAAIIPHKTINFIREQGMGLCVLTNDASRGQQLQAKKLPAALIHSQQARRDRKQILQAISNQNLKILYLSPETLLSPPIWQILIQPQVKINGIILDEAHCLVQWGTTFRPAYTRIGAVRSSLSKIHRKKIAISAFTATADPYTQQAITKTLKLYQPAKFLLAL